MLNLNLHRLKTPIPKSVLAPHIDHMKAGAKDGVNNEMLEKRFKLPD